MVRIFWQKVVRGKGLASVENPFNNIRGNHNEKTRTDLLDAAGSGINS